MEEDPTDLARERLQFWAKLGPDDDELATRRWGQAGSGVADLQRTNRLLQGKGGKGRGKEGKAQKSAAQKKKLKRGGGQQQSGRIGGGDPVPTGLDKVDGY